MFSCLQILEAFLWFVLITLLNVTLIILTLSVSRLLNLLLRLVAFLLFPGHRRRRGRGQLLATDVGGLRFALAAWSDAQDPAIVGIEVEGDLSGLGDGEQANEHRVEVA